MDPAQREDLLAGPARRELLPSPALCVEALLQALQRGSGCAASPGRPARRRFQRPVLRPRPLAATRRRPARGDVPSPRLTPVGQRLPRTTGGERHRLRRPGQHGPVLQTIRPCPIFRWPYPIVRWPYPIVPQTREPLGFLPGAYDSALVTLQRRVRPNRVSQPYILSIPLNHTS